MKTAYMKPKLIPYGNNIFFDYHDNMAVICREHMEKTDFKFHRQDLGYSFFECLEGPHEIILNDSVDRIRERILRRLESKRYQEAEYLDIDGYLTPASKESQVKTKSGVYSITAQIKNSDKHGEQIVIYAAKKGIKGKSQIFIDPSYGKLTFDQNDVSPKDIFTKLEATFRDGSEVKMSSPNENDK